MRKLTILFVLLAVGCDGGVDMPSANNTPNANHPNANQPGESQLSVNQPQTLLEAREGFETKIVNAGEFAGEPDIPNGDKFKMIHYQSPVGKLAAYVTNDPRDGKKHPAIVWITGGDNNSIGDVWSPSDRSNDQSVSAFRKAGIVVMFPSQRGGNNNPGKREGFFGEVDDVIAATDHLATLPYVDPDQIYLGGHSTGGTMAMLIGECTDRYRGIFSLGPVASVGQYGGNYVYCDPNDEEEIRLRSPMHWMHCVKKPMFVLEGEDGNWNGSIEIMAKSNANPNIKFFRIDGHDHFSVIGPLVEILAEQVVGGQVNLTQETFAGLK